MKSFHHFFASLCALCIFVVNFIQAHPVPQKNHDRTIGVRLTTDGKSGAIMVLVNYRLEVDPFTVVYDDLPAVIDKAELSKLSKPKEFYEAFTRCYAPILATRLVATLDGKTLEFTCAQQGYRLDDEEGRPLGHLRCDFVFQAHAPPVLPQPTPAPQHRFTFREGNYVQEDGLIRLSLTGDGTIQFVSKVEPDAALKEKPLTELQPGDDAKLRNVAATFTLGMTAREDVKPPAEPVKSEQPAAPSSTESISHSKLQDLLDSQQGFWVLLVLAALFGAAHALTPGHGKTLVAGYLVGERGTVGHAFLLGLVTTLTHTGSVLLLAVGLLFFFPKAVPRDIQTTLGLIGGLLVAGLGFWLLLRRLSGGADHVHIGGHGHHHHHGHTHHHDGLSPADHYHDEQGQAHPLPEESTGVRWWNLAILGISGGLVPCWDAILMLGFAISAQRLWLGLPLLLAFSAGLAGVLIAIGVAVVYLKGFASSHWGQNRLVRALPIISAVLVTVMGLWLCYDSVHANEEPGVGRIGNPSSAHVDVRP
jgi:ABC-type nickel/cobalt efflux system permease component RcnA